MGIDAELLQLAIARREKLESLQDELESTRVGFTRLVRHLYVAGATLREIAEALGLSHQRVHQIVGEGGPVDSNEVDTPGILACTFCGRDKDTVRHLVAGPGCYICSDCVPEVIAVAENNKSDGRHLPVRDERTKCSFCAKSAKRVGWLVETTSEQATRICNECMKLVEEILAELG